MSGCWSEVEYTEPVASEKATSQSELPAPAIDEHANPATGPSTSSTPAATTSDDASKAAGGFGDDLAATLATEEPSSTSVDPADTTPIEESDPTSAAVVGDRYAAKTPQTETPASEPGEQAATPPAEDSFDSLFDEPPAEDLAATDPPVTATPETPSATDTVESLFGESDAAAAPAPGENTVDDSMLPEEREAIAETTDETIANLDDDDIPAPSATAARNSRRAAWLLGSKLSLAALANDYNAPDDEVLKLYGQSRSLAEMLGVTVRDLPARPAADAPTSLPKPGLNYLLGAAGQEIGRELARRQSADQAALFEVAVKSNLLLVLYQPGASTTQAVAEAIGRAGPRANLPATLWQPLLDTLAQRAPLGDVRKAVYKLHADADKYLEQPVE